MPFLVNVAPIEPPTGLNQGFGTRWPNDRDYPPMWAYGRDNDYDTYYYSGDHINDPLPDSLTFTPDWRVSLVKVPELTQYLLEELWSEYRRFDYYRGAREFEPFILERANVPDGWRIQFCLCCAKPLFDDCVETSNGSVCEHCDEYSVVTCEDCDERVIHYNYAGDSLICTLCTERRYCWCDDCDTYVYAEDYETEHQHGRCPEGGDCLIDTYDVSLRNDGEGTIRQDQRTLISLPAGAIDEAGIRRIQRHLSLHGTYCPPELLDEVGDQWQTKRGNFTRRLSSALHNYGKQYLGESIKISPEVMSEIGCIARDHSGTASEWSIEISRDLNMSAADWYHEDSCWWGGYESSRCWLKHNGGFGIRTFAAADTSCTCQCQGECCTEIDQGEHLSYCGSLRDPRDVEVSGRVWVLPLKVGKADGRGTTTLTPTFDTMNADAFVTFNGYGELSQYSAARILAHMVGMTYRKIEFSAEPMYVNAGGILVSSQEICDATERLYLDVDCHSGLYYSENIPALAIGA